MTEFLHYSSTLNSLLVFSFDAETVGVGKNHDAER